MLKGTEQRNMQAKEHHSRIVVYVSVSVFAGLVAGFIGVTLVLSGSLRQVPFFNAFRLDKILPEQNVVIKEQQAVTIEEEEHIAKLTPQLKSGVVTFVYTRSRNGTYDVYTNDDVSGFGMVIASDGWILTTANVVSDDSFKNMQVVTSDGDAYAIKDIITDPKTEYVFVHIIADKLHSLAFAPDKPLMSSEPLLALSASLPSGQLVITEAVVRQLGETNGLLSSDTLPRMVMLNESLPYSGPIVNFSGEVVGFGTGSTTVIPAYHITSHVSDVLLTHKLERKEFGITWIDLNNSIGLDDDVRQGLYKGALVTSVSTDIKNILKKDDIIRRVNDVEVNGGLTFAEMMQKYSMGDTVFLTVLRDGNELELELDLDSD